MKIHHFWFLMCTNYRALCSMNEDEVDGLWFGGTDLLKGIVNNTSRSFVCMSNIKT